MSKRTLICPNDRRYSVVLDPSEIFPNDPGNGTPAMVYGPNGTSATYNCAIGESELTNSRGGGEGISASAYRWLDEEVFEAVEAMFEAFDNSANV